MVKLKVERDPAGMAGSLSKKLFRIGYIGGGYVRFCTGISNKAYDDIDIYPVSSNAVPVIEEIIKAIGYKPAMYPGNYYNGSFTIQIVDSLIFKNTKEIIENMPCGVQEIVFNPEGEILASEDFEYFEQQNLVNLKFGIKNPPSIARYEAILANYIRKGYKVTDSSYMGIAMLAAVESFDKGYEPIGAIALDAEGIPINTAIDCSNDNPLYTSVFNASKKCNPHTIYTTLEPSSYDLAVASQKGVRKIVFGEKNFIKDKDLFNPEMQLFEYKPLKGLPLNEDIRNYVSSYENCENFWDLTGKYPIPKYPISCPSCKCMKTIPNRYRFHTVEDSPTKYRCAISFKCHNCSRTWWENGKPDDRTTQMIAYGVVIPEEMYNRVKNYYNVEEDFIPPITWRDIDNIE